jgi:phosphotransferase system  glucose/maltose/N-acetylglucosamine-specific IIC component
MFVLLVNLIPLIINTNNWVSSLPNLIIPVIGIIILFLIFYIFYISIIQEVGKEKDIEFKKGTLVYESRITYTSKIDIYPIWGVMIAYPLIIISLIFYNLISLKIVNLEHIQGYITLSVGFLILIIMYPSIRQRYIWIYKNCIGISGSYREFIYFGKDLDKIEIHKKNTKKEQKIQLKIQFKDEKALELELMGETVDDLFNPLKKYFDGLLDIV